MNPRAPQDRSVTFDKVARGALTTLGRGDVPPHGEGFEAGQELRPGEETGCPRKGLQDWDILWGRPMLASATCSLAVSAKENRRGAAQV
jgi:hypothetical protein